jgi:hypothetical protein
MGGIPMAEQNKVDKTHDPHRKDQRILVIMLAIYTICCIIFVSGSFIWIREDRKAVSANATTTEAVAATQQANMTATAVAHATEQAQYDFIEKFDTNANLWRAKREDSEYWKGIIRVMNGTYIWDVEETKQTFVSWAKLPGYNYMEDFDAYVDTKILDVGPGDVCSGFQFRVAPSGWDNGGYYFALCNNSKVIVSYHTELDGWETIATRLHENYVDDWNRLEINARGSHFSFFINGELVYEMDDTRRKGGGLALVIELNEKVPATIWFDNFGYQVP